MKFDGFDQGARATIARYRMGLDHRIRTSHLCGGGESADRIDHVSPFGGDSRARRPVRRRGAIPGCTATLIDQETALTVAHCVCVDQGPGANLGTCTGRATFTLHDVIPAPDPDTPWLIPTSRTDVSIQGTVYVHPDYEQASWLFYDIAIIKPDRPPMSASVMCRRFRSNCNYLMRPVRR
ncbi:trypsin-like serine protease [Candidatus Bipolaricaulota bacterium]|nr:trypsin-like serine protease [Candidatus Bipolaricaulota bacterium]